MPTFYSSYIILKNNIVARPDCQCCALSSPEWLPYPKPFKQFALRGFVASIELHSNQMWKDLMKFYKLNKVLTKILKHNKVK